MAKWDRKKSIEEYEKYTRIDNDEEFLNPPYQPRAHSSSSFEISNKLYFSIVLSPQIILFLAMIKEIFNECRGGEIFSCIGSIVLITFICCPFYIPTEKTPRLIALVLFFLFWYWFLFSYTRIGQALLNSL